ncbi:L10-interacting MYB domain-containing protein [Ricinus communis]|nr:L10-interacting MYB domain-containing protein [Ricinus communis]XP_015576996.1 L10-interacting MYB domain-containing protein [Ricinus communis]|eukprot:XP_015576992.1 L10-interacting MYB domain-containing protein [Ricinus communis]
MDIETGNHPKHERSRKRWTASLDKIFADLVVKHIQLGNRPNNVFDKKTWNHIRDEFNKQTDLNFNNNQLRKHLDVLRTRYYNLKSAFVQNEFTMEDSCCIGFDLWEDVGAQPRPEAIKVKDCPIYEQLCAIFTDTSADGKYAQSSHFEGLEKTVGNGSAGLTSHMVAGSSHSENPSSSRPMQGNPVLPDNIIKNIAERKRKRQLETQSSSEQNKKDQEINEAMAEALLEMVAASSWRKVSLTQKDKKFTIANCIKALDEIGDVDQQLYFAALDLFEDPNFRETFLSLKGDQLRLTWLQGKCGRSNIFF